VFISTLDEMYSLSLSLSVTCGCSDWDEFIQRQNTKAKAFNLNFRYIHDVLSINNPNFANWIPLLYPQIESFSFCILSLNKFIPILA
jgi:hypothetical protein